MRINDRLWARTALLCAGLAMAGLSASAAAGTGRLRAAAACAAYELHLITLIEDHGRAESMEGSALAGAMMEVARARAACRDGDAERALELYGRVSLDPPRVGPADWVFLR